jgi:hypothetical protein
MKVSTLLIYVAWVPMGEGTSTGMMRMKTMTMAVS